MTSVGTRAAAVLALLLALFGLAVWMGSLGPAPALGDLPREPDLAADYDDYLGDRVEVSGTVVATDPVVIRSVYGTGEYISLTVTDLRARPEPGELLRVHGVAEPDRTVRALNAFAVPPSGTRYTLAISFLAGVWVIGRLLRGWRLDGDWTLARRTTPLRLRDRLGGDP